MIAFVRRGIPLLLCALGVSSFADAPKLDYLFPAGGQIGTETSITLGGSFEPWPVKVWADQAEITATTETNKGKIHLKIATNAALGPHLLRIYNADGSSAPKIFFVGAAPEHLEQEPNDALNKAQVVTNLPAVINGKFDKGGDSDAFALKLEAGKKLVARVCSYSLGSPVDPVIELVNEKGIPVAFNHDYGNLDPLLAWQVTASGKYFVRVMAFAHPAQMNVNFTGSAASVYRLLLTDGPYPRSAQPLGLKRSGSNPRKLMLWNAPELSADLKLPLQPWISAQNQVEFAYVALTNSPEAIRFPVSDCAEVLGKEPNNTIAEAQPVELPCAISGELCGKADVDRFAFNAKKDQSFAFSALSYSLGFPVTGVIRLEGIDGKELARSDINTEAREPEVTWRAPQDGKFVVAFSDLRKITATNLQYRLSAIIGQPDFSLASDEHSFVLERGKTNELKIKIDRKFGFNEKLKLEIQNLPAGLALIKHEASASENSATLAISVPADAQPFSGAVVVRALGENKENPRSHTAMFNLRGDDSEQAGHLAVDATDWLWLTVRGGKL